MADCRHLPGLSAVVRRLRRRRGRRPAGHHLAADRTLADARRRRRLAVAVLPLAAGRRRLRRQRLLRRRSDVRHARGLSTRWSPRAHELGPAGDRRPRAEPHLRPAPLVPARARRPARGRRRGPYLFREREPAERLAVGVRRAGLDPASAGRSQWYLHLFDPSSPTSTGTNPEVRAEFERILRFWLDRGVDGFRVDVAHGLVKDPSFPSYRRQPVGPAGQARSAVLGPGGGARHLPRLAQDPRRVHGRRPESAADPVRRGDVAIERAIRYVRPDEMHQTFNFRLPADAVGRGGVARGDRRLARPRSAASGAPATWVLSNHDVVRHASRLRLPGRCAAPDGGRRR